MGGVDHFWFGPVSHSLGLGGAGRGKKASFCTHGTPACGPVLGPAASSRSLVFNPMIHDSWLPCQGNFQIEKRKLSRFMTVLANISNAKLVSEVTRGDEHQIDKT